ncbi:hypothetical protein SCHPADRAFT_900682 [Schizopora paradoxa]|uniref:TFIIS N-terminal domain-containing protein n=1 Tax=Schizopora paradoxa TaxID=27342 RepID=A0A0H2S0P9_9AGAM|nr:hypothetical protein SCHPADRAFT_900682 [Schizopora paradoxa]
MSNRRLERDIFGGSDSELSSEDEGGVEEEVQERRRESPDPQREREVAESSGDSADEYVQEKAPKKKVKRRARRDDEEESRPVQKKRKRKAPAPPPVEIDFDSMPPEQARKMQLQMQIDDIVKKNKTHRPKKRKGADEDALDRFADEEVSQLREEMLKAAAEDDDANKDKVPATSKLRLLPRVKEVLQKSSLSQSILDNNLLDGVRRWLEPLPDRSLPALNIQSFFFEQLSKMYIDTNSLKDSGLGRIILFYTKCRRVTTPISRMAHDLISTWSRPIIKRSASYRDRQLPVAADPGTRQRAEKLNSILARAKENERDRVRKNAVMIPTPVYDVVTVAPRTGGMKHSQSVENDIERRKKNAERLRSLTRKVATSKN